MREELIMPMMEEVMPGPIEDTSAGMQQEVIGKAEIQAAREILQKYKQGKANLEKRIIDNEQWFKLRHWEQIGMPHADKDPYPASAWLFNSISNKHADAMDNVPEPAILPREEGDKNEAEVLTSILPMIMEQNEFESTYSDVWWYKLKSGTGVYGVFWNSQKQNGIGDIDIRKIDLLKLFWEPGIEDIQDSRNLFNIELVDNEYLKQKYPQLENTLGGSAISVNKYIYDDTVDTSEKSMVIDWYYKKATEGGDTVHYCKFVNEEILYASENDPTYAQKGFYDHGKYPFVFDPLFMVEGTPAGFGYIDIMKSPQMYIDKMDQLIIKNTMMSSKKRFFIRGDGAVNEDEFADWNNDFVHVTGSDLGEGSIREIRVDQIPAICVQVKQAKVEELKETSGNRDFSQGSTSSGVTAASAIAALQEAGSKLSRDMLKSGYRAYAQICRFCIELIRQFYDVPRMFRVLGENGAQKFVTYDNRALVPQPVTGAFGVGSGYRVPEFDIKIKAQKASSFSKIAQNELAKELYGLGFFNPQLADQALVCVDMMDFEGKQQVVNKIVQNGTLYQKLMQMQQQMVQMAQIIDAQNGSNLSQMLGAAPLMQGQAPQSFGGTVETDSLGQAKRKSGSATTDKAREKAADAASPEAK